ncbi:MAG: tyrosine-type recombinase/integrase [Candidatus Competibacteraceae bacterium]|nr:tyrosine-type recombinase/integrase [Candidatus Competibacteraceae bacterium]
MAKSSERTINFTKASLEALPIPDHPNRVAYYDTKGNGLHIVVTSQGQKTFYIRKRLNGKNEKHRLGPFPDLSVEQARDKAAKFVGAVASGENPAEVRRNLQGELTLGLLFEQYLERHLKKSRKTWSETEKSFERYFGDWKDRKLSSISQMELDRRHLRIKEQRGPYSANRAHELIRALYNKAIIWRFYQGINPAIGITPFQERSRERVLQSDEFSRFFKALESEEADFRDVIMLTLLTGARKSTVLSMSWADINLKAGTWIIPSEKSKNSRSQVIVLTESELEILRRRHRNRPKDSSFVFPSESRTGHLTDIKKSWQSFLKRAEIANLHIHDLRRSLASWMASTGANVSVIRSALNHQDVKTTLTVYARANKEAELAARRIAHNRMIALGKGAKKGADQGSHAAE